jgi:hypothetical protein
VLFLYSDNKEGICKREEINEAILEGKQPEFLGKYL